MTMPTQIRGKTSRTVQNPDELCARDRALLVDALEALLRERLRAVETIREVGSDRTRGAFIHDDFGVADILRLARMLDRHARL
jgi:hypothetical protein